MPTANNDGFAVNPFTLVFDALWSILESSPQFANDVKVSNRIHLNVTNKRDPLKQQIQDADLPEVILVSNGATDINHYYTSSTSKITKQYRFLVSTGDIRVQNYLNQIQWDIFCCFTGWNKLISSLDWPVGSGNTFVKLASVLEIEEGLADSDRNRGIVGWSSIWGCQIEMHFATSDLINYRGY